MIGAVGSVRLRGLVGLLASLALAGCVGRAIPPSQPPVPQPPPALPQPIPPSDPLPPPPAGFRQPAIMAVDGLRDILRANAAGLQRRFGPPRLDVVEGDMRKLQFAGDACVLDVFLYPLSPGAEPVATWVEARRASDGQAVDRVACAAALGRGR